MEAFMLKRERWHIKGPRKFGDKRYKFDRSFSSKRAAELHRDELVRKGYLVRITVQKGKFGGPNYRLWMRKR